MQSVHRIILIISCFSLGACAWGYKEFTGFTRYPKVPVEHVELLDTFPNRQFKQIGIVRSWGGTATPDSIMVRKIRQVAADIGADAVVYGGDTSVPFQISPASSTTSASIGASPYLNTIDMTARSTFNDAMYVGTPLKSGIAIKYINVAPAHSSPQKRMEQ